MQYSIVIRIILLEKPMLEASLSRKMIEEFKYKAENIDKLAYWAYEKECKRISEKYSNIDTTVKILNGLVGDFVRKADKIEKNALAKAKVDEAELQRDYFQNRITECLQLSENLRQEINQRREKVSQRETDVNGLKKRLIQLKTNNIKLVMQIEQMERGSEAAHLQDQREFNHTRRKLVAEQSSRMIVEQMPPLLPPGLIEENMRVQHELAAKMNEAKELGECVCEIFSSLRDKLRKNETKSNGFGLAGSLLFKISTSGKAPNKQKQVTRKTDSKLLIYDVLKRKYERVMKEQQQEKQEFHLTMDEFLQYSASQIVGVIELKGGFQSLRWKTGLLPQKVKEKQTRLCPLE